MNVFYLGQLSIMVAVNEINEMLDTERNTPVNERAMTALVEELRTCAEDGMLISVCQSIATMAIGKMSLESELFGGKRLVTPRDVRIIYAGLRKLSKELEGPENSDSSPELITIRRALARMNYAVSLVFAAIYGGEFRYRIKILGKNGIPEFQEKRKKFLGIPQDHLPKKTDGRTDFRINPETVQALYGALQSIEKEESGQSTSGQKTLSIRERIVRLDRGCRKGEAEFFLEHLPKGLSYWAETTLS